MNKFKKYFFIAFKIGLTRKTRVLGLYYLFDSLGGRVGNGEYYNKEG